MKKEKPPRPSFRTDPPWSMEEDTVLLECYGVEPVYRIAKRLKRTSAAVRGRYDKLRQLLRVAV